MSKSFLEAIEEAKDGISEAIRVFPELDLSSLFDAGEPGGEPGMARWIRSAAYWHNVSAMCKHALVRLAYVRWQEHQQAVETCQREFAQLENAATGWTRNSKYKKQEEIRNRRDQELRRLADAWSALRATLERTHSEVDRARIPTYDKLECLGSFRDHERIQAWRVADARRRGDIVDPEPLSDAPEPGERLFVGERFFVVETIVNDCREYEAKSPDLPSLEATEAILEMGNGDRWTLPPPIGYSDAFTARPRGFVYLAVHILESEFAASDVVEWKLRMPNGRLARKRYRLRLGPLNAPFDRTLHEGRHVSDAASHRLHWEGEVAKASVQRDIIREGSD